MCGVYAVSAGAEGRWARGGGGGDERMKSGGGRRKGGEGRGKRGGGGGEGGGETGRGVAAAAAGLLVPLPPGEGQRSAMWALSTREPDTGARAGGRRTEGREGGAGARRYGEEKGGREGGRGDYSKGSGGRAVWSWEVWRFREENTSTICHGLVSNVSLSACAGLSREERHIVVDETGALQECSHHCSRR